MKKIYLISLIFLFFPFVSQATNHYIREGGTGNGNDWTNALDDLPAAFIRGDIYYVADGVYGGHEFKTAASGNQYITIKKATQADHGTEAGWQNEWGNGQAVFEGAIIFSADYWIFDGVHGEKDASVIMYGFKIAVINCSTASKLITIGNGADDIVIRYVDMQHCGTWEKVGTLNQDCFYCISSDDGGSNNITVSHCYLHNVNRVMMLINNAKNVTVEHCYFKKRYRGPDSAYPHGQAISINYSGLNANHVYRYNIFEDISGTSIITPKDSIQSQMYIYGNIIFNCDGSRGLITNTTNDTNTYMYVYNNSFINCTGQTGINWDGSSTGNIAYNNLWFDCSNIYFLGVTHDYNAFSGANNYGETINGQTGLLSSIFKNYSNNDFSLNSATEAGKNDLGSPYNQDITGSTRGQDSVWDRGAYEYVSGSPPPPTCTILGDLSCNQEVDAPDIQIAINVFLGLETNQERIQRSDVNTDSKTDILDIQKIVNLFLESIL